MSNLLDFEDYKRIKEWNEFVTECSLSCETSTPEEILICLEEYLRSN